jgi:drug/metabolite transporter (DMT)-like permease
MTAPSRPLAGAVWMVVTGLLFVCMTAIVKHVGSDVPAAQSAFLRYAMGLPFLIPMIRPILQARLTARQKGLFATRGIVHTLGVILWFYAMTRIPLAEVTAMGYLTPVLVTLGAAIILGEGLALRRLVAILAAFAGALVVLRPGLREIDPGHLAMLCNALFFASSYLIAKKLSAEVSATVVVGMLSLTVTLGLAPFAFAVWVPPTATELGWFFLTACFATAGHYTMTFAFAAAPVTVTQPVTFLQLIWSVSLGALVFSEPVDAFVILGGVIILGAVSFITWRESRLRKVVTEPLPEARG